MTRSAEPQLISLLTDFGLVDSYVSEMKAVILSICPTAKIVDISHSVEKFNIRMGAFILASAIPSFPVGTVHIAVVDPGVGSSRRAIVIETERSIFAGPDNGLLMPAAQAEGIVHVYQITNSSMMRGQVSATFHGRDIFASVGAYLARGTQPGECGTEISDFVTPSYSEPKAGSTSVVGEVFHVDGFGNVITNLRSTNLVQFEARKKLRVYLNKKHLWVRRVNAYVDLRDLEYGLIVGSHGFLEIVCSGRSAAKRIGARTGMDVRFSSVWVNR
jgi:S-adenosylmethionine hydrolase